MSEPTISQTITKAIRESERQGLNLSEVYISDYAALALADELSAFPLVPRATGLEIYESLKSGDVKLLGRQVIVAV